MHPGKSVSKEIANSSLHKLMTPEELVKSSVYQAGNRTTPPNQ